MNSIAVMPLNPHIFVTGGSDALGVQSPPVLMTSTLVRSNIRSLTINKENTEVSLLGLQCGCMTGAWRAVTGELLPAKSAGFPALCQPI